MKMSGITSNRRRFLVKTGSAIGACCTAGCISDTQKEVNKKQTGSAKLTQEEQTTLSPQNYQFEWTGTVNAPRSDKHPPRIRLELRNTSASEVSIGFGPVQPFADPFGESDGGNGLLLYNPRMGPAATPTNTSRNCPSLSTKDIAIHDVLKTTALTPGESVSATYDVYNHVENDRCYPDGEYGFEDVLPVCRRQNECTGATKLRLRTTAIIENNRLASVETAHRIGA